MKYKVVYKCSIIRSEFDFDDGRNALEFARSMLKHLVPDADGNKQTVEIQLLGDEDADNG